MQLINALLQPYARAEEFMLRAELPKPAQEAVVNPKVAFVELAGLEEGVPDLVNLEDATKQDGSYYFFIGFGPVVAAGVVQVDAVDLPIKGFGGLVPIFEVNQPFPLGLLIRTSIDMAHRLDKHPQHALALPAVG